MAMGRMKVVFLAFQVAIASTMVAFPTLAIGGVLPRTMKVPLGSDL